MKQFKYEVKYPDDDKACGIIVACSKKAAEASLLENDCEILDLQQIKPGESAYGISLPDERTYLMKMIDSLFCWWS